MSTFVQVRAGWLLNGSAAPAAKDMLLTITDGVITGLDPYREGLLVEGAHQYDLSHGVIMPPFIDCHLHLAMSGTTDKEVRDSQLQGDCKELEPQIRKHLQQLWEYGVCAVRDGGDRGECVTTLLTAGELDQYQVLIESPGKAYHRQGRYGSLIGRCPEVGESLLECYQRTRGDNRWLKLVNSGLNSLKKYGQQTKPQFMASEIEPFIESVVRDGGRVMVHANGEEPVREALLAGCHSIEHGFFMGRDNLEMMAERGCYWIPTAGTMKAYADIFQYNREYTKSEVAARTLENQLQQLKWARESGVKIALGTDAGSPGVLHGESVFEEMKLFARAGFSLPEIIQSATSTAAELMGLKNVGQLRVGAAANFLVTRGTPAQLPRKFSYLENIFVAGQPSPRYRKNPQKHVGNVT